jgi:hypothetical protein
MGGRVRTRASGFAATVGTAFDAMRAELAADPTFHDDYGNDLDRMRALVTAPHVKTPLELAGVFIGGAAGMVIPAEEARHMKEDTYMYAGLRLLRTVAFAENRSRQAPALVMAEGQASVVFGNLTIDGSVRLGPQASLVVLGDMTIGGNLLANVWYSRIAVGGTLSLGSGITEGELIAGTGIHVRDTLYLHGNDVSCRAPRLTGKTVLVADKYNRFTSIEVETFLDDRADPDAGAKIEALLGSEEAFIAGLA